MSTPSSETELAAACPDAELPRPVLLIDNYDSFVFNLSRYVVELGMATRVLRNDAMSAAQLIQLRPAAVIISPGPCGPEQAGVCVELIRRCPPSIPLLGVCLGHQCLAVAWGGAIQRSVQPVHGRTSLVRHDGGDLWSGLPNPLRATRYHSLEVDRSRLPAELEVTAETEDGIVMGLRHRSRPQWGVQFHPESILTQGGHQLLGQFLLRAGLPCRSWASTELPPVSDDCLARDLPGPLHW